jgi:hypothetical protein
MSIHEQRSGDEREVDPAKIVIVRDCSSDVLKTVIAHLEVSTEFEHLVYREAELDALWSLTDFHLMTETDLIKRNGIEQLHRAVHQAHDLVADRQPAAAAAVLRALL